MYLNTIQRIEFSIEYKLEKLERDYDYKEIIAESRELFYEMENAQDEYHKKLTEIKKKADDLYEKYRYHEYYN